jgi:hypothetical protein
LVNWDESFSLIFVCSVEMNARDIFIQEIKTMHYAKNAKKWGVAMCATLLLAPTAYAKEKKAAPAKDPTKSFIEQSVKDYQTCLEVNLKEHKGYISPDQKTDLLQACGERVSVANLIRTSVGFLGCVEGKVPLIGTEQSSENGVSMILRDGRQYSFSVNPTENAESREALSTEDKEIKKNIEACALKSGMQVFDFQRVKEEPTRDDSAIEKRHEVDPNGGKLNI